MLASRIIVTFGRKSSKTNYTNNNFLRVIVNQAVCRSKTKSSASVRALNRKFDQMIRIKFNDNENRVSISLRCKLINNNDQDAAETAASVASSSSSSPTVIAEREFNLNRSQDEEIGTTFQKLYANYQKFANFKSNKVAAKKQKTSIFKT